MTRGRIQSKHESLSFVVLYIKIVSFYEDFLKQRGVFLHLHEVFIYPAQQQLVAAE